MKVQLVILAAVALVAMAAPQRGTTPDRDNHGAQVLRVNANTITGLGFLSWLQTHTLLDFWTEPSRLGEVDIMAGRWDLPILKSALERRGMSFTVQVSDVAGMLRIMDSRHKAAKAKSTRMDWTSYHDYDEISAWLDELVATYPDIASVTDVGQSFEGRTMKLLKLSTGGSGKDAIFTDGGIHAREWISPATVTYFINELVSGNDEGILDAVDLYFMPSINPDGYAYTFTNDRLWRKTRSTDPANICIGADPNRNWDFHWMEGGASDNPCAETYAGPVPFSEIEMRNVRDVLNSLQPRVYLTFHSYSQLWMYPWGYTSDLPDNWQDLDALAQDAVSALTAVYGTQYEIGSSTNTIYIAAGGSDDWALGAGGSEYAYTVELRDQGRYGFELPESQIVESGQETYEAFKVVGHFVANNRRQ